MFDIGWTEMMVVVLVLILVVGPKDLPKVVRTVGQWTAKARRMSREFTSSLEEIGRETELDDLRRDLNSIGGGSSVTALNKHIDPDGSLKKAIDGNVAGSVESQPAEALAKPAALEEDDKPASIPADGDAVAAAAQKADDAASHKADAAAAHKADDAALSEQSTQPPAKAGASTA